ncbi:RagB/SusD family nutrient uptake outer membrane protein [Aegicerativicinus sediminis]|uniref:RagB/SusD family nutrient uptake outer membrane protein n=1 Tax=Aegicerativicinus sediminis TaxID=2893202 RepID=UPI001E5F1F7D|nr:RagB/SusD family nutrient uptake outer membrane protein [Aegicerativicinus sediminis]
MKNLILLILIVFTFSSCEDNLDPVLYGSLNPTTFPKTESDYELYTLDLYQPFRLTWGFDEGGWRVTFFGPEDGTIQLFDAPTDLMIPFSAWGNGAVFWDAKSRGNFTPLVAQGRDRSHFEKTRLVTKATQTIGSLEEATIFTDDAFKNRLLGEARMARGWTMYFMLQLYGPVPVITDPSLVGNIEAESDLTRPSREVYVSQVVADLRFAADNLPQNPSEYGRFNKGHALVVLMRLYLNEKNFQMAESVGREIQGLGYSLVDDYTSLFREATERNSETIFAISCDPTSQGRQTDGNFNPFSYYTHPTDFPVKPGWAWPGVYTATWEFYDTFDPNDERRSFLVDTYSPPGYTMDRSNMAGPVINKYPAEGPNAYQGNDVVISRYGDVLLMLAEAINENNGGPTQEAIDLVNEIRLRANIQPLSSEDTASKSAFNDAILRERSWELYFEGFRLLDLRRHGKWPSALQSISGKNPGPSIYPIPQFALDDGATQNDGY